MGTNCAPLLADIFLHSNKAEGLQSLLSTGKKLLAFWFNFTCMYIHVLFRNNLEFENYLDKMYPVKPERTRQIIRYRVTVTLRRLQIKQYAERGLQNQREYHIILTKYEQVHPTENNSSSGMLMLIFWQDPHSCKRSKTRQSATLLLLTISLTSAATFHSAFTFVIGWWTNMHKLQYVLHKINWDWHSIY